MKIVIIEDEKITAEDLAELIIRLEPEAQIVRSLGSVKEGIEYFKNHPSPDLIFSDIQLGDGLSFDIFKTVEISVPIIFCTAYDEYALNAFRTSGIDYLLKPVVSSSVEQAFQKYHSLRKGFSGTQISYDAILDLFAGRVPQKTSSILVNYKDKIIPVKMEQIAMFYIRNDEVNVLTFEDKSYVLSKKMDELERISGDDFFRVNRQYLLSRKAVKDASHFFSRKLVVNLSVPFKENITVSKEKTPFFLNWLSSK